MAEPTPLENALYRMRSYQALLAVDQADRPRSAAADLKILIDWIDYVRPLLGAVSPQPAGDFLYQPRRAAPASTPSQPPAPPEAQPEPPETQPKPADTQPPEPATQPEPPKAA